MTFRVARLTGTITPIAGASRADRLTSAVAGQRGTTVQLFVLMLGVIISALGLALLVRPAAMLGLIDKIFDSRWLYLVALIRFLVGAGLIAAAPAVAFTPVVAVLGWLFALGGLLLVTIPAPTVRRIVAWFIGLPLWQTRLWTLLAMLLGLFFMYAAIGP